MLDFHFFSEIEGCFNEILKKSRLWDTFVQKMRHIFWPQKIQVYVTARVAWNLTKILWDPEILKDHSPPIDYQNAGKQLYIQLYHTQPFHHAPVHCVFFYTIERGTLGFSVLQCWCFFNTVMQWIKLQLATCRVFTLQFLVIQKLFAMLGNLNLT